MASPNNLTKMVFFRGEDVAAGGFINVASIMHDIVQKMAANGFKVVHSSTTDSILGTVAWGTLTSTGGTLSWAAGSVPRVGSPSSAFAVSGLSASITLEATVRTNYLNPTVTTSYPADFHTEPWRIKFELLNTECVAAYVATPLQLPGFTGSATNLISEPWGLPGNNTKIVDSVGVTLDCAGAIGKQNIISSYSQASSVNIGSGGSGYTIGDYIVEDSYVSSPTGPGGPFAGLYYIVGSGSPPSPFPPRKRAIFRVDSLGKAATGIAVTAAAIASTTVTLTYATQTNIPFAVASQITVEGILQSGASTGFNGVWTVVTCTTTQVTYTVPATFSPGTLTYTAAKASSNTAVTSVSIVDGGKYANSTISGGLHSATTNFLIAGNPSATGAGCTLSYILSSGAAGTDELDSLIGFYNRGTRVGAQGGSYPLTYELCLSNSGFFLGIYESNWATQVGSTNSTGVVGRFNWMLVQRPVDRLTGVVLDDPESTTSKHPVFCVNAVGGLYYTFSVREKDISHPTSGPTTHSSIKYYDATGATTGTLVSPYVSTAYNSYAYRIPAVLNSEDNHLLFNPQNQISLTEDKKYLVTFPHNLSTPRYRYTEELDLIGFTSSDVLMTGQKIDITTYTEATSRTYLALPPSNQYNTGVRVCVLYSAPTANGTF
jgi:hypothetical protein